MSISILSQAQPTLRALEAAVADAVADAAEAAGGEHASAPHATADARLDTPPAALRALFGNVYDRNVLDQLKVAGQAARGNAAGSTEEQVKNLFKEQFADKARNKEDFHAFMQQTFGDKYDRNLAESYRQKALAGDFSWLPEVRLADSKSLNGGNGAYDSAAGVIYINSELAASDPLKAAQTFVEEAGHHLDAKLNKSDTRGDEGEKFRRVLGGEQLSAQQLAKIDNENDKGTITVDGRKIEVEFFLDDIVDAVGDAAKAVGEVVVDGAKAVGEAAVNVVSEVGGAVKEVGMGVINAAEMLAQGVFVDFFAGAFMNIIEGRFADAWSSMVKGLDKAFIQTPRRLINASIEAAGHMLKTGTHLLPDKLGGNLLRDVVDRGVDSFRSVANGVIDIYRNIVRLPFEIGVGAMQDIGAALKHFGNGEWGEGFGRFGLTFVHPFKRVAGAVVDSAMIAAQAVGNVAGNVTWSHEPSRGLTKVEREYLKKVYGDSINLEDIRIHRGNITHGLGMAPHCVGNDIYLPDSGDENCFNADGSLNERGLQTLVHEAGHVYQAQQGGNDYIGNALFANLVGIVDGGNRNTAYNWLEAMRSGKPYSEWNPEQQAEFLETMGRARQGGWDTNGDGAIDRTYDLNGNGRIDRDELELAWEDKEWRRQDGTLVPRNGVRDTAASAGTAEDPEQDVTLTDDEHRQAMALWEAIKGGRPDRQVIV